MRGVGTMIVTIVVAGLVAAPMATHAQTGAGGTPTGDVEGGQRTGTPTGTNRDRENLLPGLADELPGLRPPQSTGPSLSGPIDPNTYFLGPGDVLQLLMWGKVSKALSLEVGPEGQMLLPGAGLLSVADRTLADVRKDVIQRMSREFRDVNMDLRLQRPRTFRVYLAGQVHNPGPLDVNASYRVTDVLSPAMFLDDASRRRIEVRHRDGRVDHADLERFTRLGETGWDRMLEDGDVLTVPVATDFIYAAGAVANPGRIELAPGDSLLTLFHLAGDPLPAADADRALLVRFTKPFEPESLWFGLAEVYSGHVNPALRDGDRLYLFFIPQYHLQHEAVIIGEVARPGSYPIVEGRHHLSDLVRSAGGFLTSADLSAIRVHRPNPNSGEKDPELDRLLRLSRNELTNTEYEILRTKLANLKEDFRVDWNRLMGDKANLDPLLRDGDVIRVDRLVPSVRVDGEVLRPGIIAYTPGLKVEDYIERAGGYSNRAWKGRVRVTRSVTGQTLLAKNVPSLDPGDVVWVPEKRDSNLAQGAQTFLLFAAQVATIVLAVVTIRHF